jgi:hypothetical protein
MSRISVAKSPVSDVRLPKPTAQREAPRRVAQPVTEPDPDPRRHAYRAVEQRFERPARPPVKPLRDDDATVRIFPPKVEREQRVAERNQQSPRADRPIRPVERREARPEAQAQAVAVAVRAPAPIGLAPGIVLPQPAAAAQPKRGGFGGFWRGETDLARAFILFASLGGAVMYLLLAVLGAAAKSSPAASIALVVASFAWLGFQSTVAVGCWRSAGSHMRNTGDKLTGWTARVLVVAPLIVFALFFVIGFLAALNGSKT